MVSAKFITLCFAFLTVITVMVAPVLSGVSGMLCAGIGAFGCKNGISNTQYTMSAIMLLLIAGRLVWLLQ